MVWERTPVRETEVQEWIILRTTRVTSLFSKGISIRMDAIMPQIMMISMSSRKMWTTRMMDKTMETTYMRAEGTGMIRVLQMIWVSSISTTTRTKKTTCSMLMTTSCRFLRILSPKRIDPTMERVLLLEVDLREASWKYEPTQTTRITTRNTDKALAKYKLNVSNPKEKTSFRSPIRLKDLGPKAPSRNTRTIKSSRPHQLQLCSHVTKTNQGSFTTKTT